MPCSLTTYATSHAGRWAGTKSAARWQAFTRRASRKSQQPSHTRGRRRCRACQTLCCLAGRVEFGDGQAGNLQGASASRIAGQAGAALDTAHQSRDESCGGGSESQQPKMDASCNAAMAGQAESQQQAAGRSWCPYTQLPPTHSQAAAGSAHTQQQLPTHSGCRRWRRRGRSRRWRCS